MKIVIAGFGDTGLLAAVSLAEQGHDIVGITPKPCHHSMQELGGRLAQPELWQQLYFNSFKTYTKLGQVHEKGPHEEGPCGGGAAAPPTTRGSVRLVQAHVTAVDLQQQFVTVTLPPRETGAHSLTERYVCWILHVLLLPSTPNTRMYIPT